MQTNVTRINAKITCKTGKPLNNGSPLSVTLILNTGAPQRCVLSPLLYSLFTRNCVAKHTSNTTLKLADGTIVVGLITDNNETAYREEVRDLAVWCQDNSLSLNVSKTKELIMDYKNINRAEVEWVESFKFLGVHITNKPSWSKHTKTVAGMTPIHPQETEKIYHGSPDPQKVIQLHHRDHSDWLPHRLVWQQLGI